MKYLLIFLLMMGCTESKDIPTSYVDVSALPECDKRILKKDEFVYFIADDRNILYIAHKTNYMCLKRVK